MTFLVGVNSHPPCPLTFWTGQFYYHRLIPSVSVWTHTSRYRECNTISEYAYFTSSIQKMSISETAYCLSRYYIWWITFKKYILYSLNVFSMKEIQMFYTRSMLSVSCDLQRHLQLLFYSLVGFRKFEEVVGLLGHQGTSCIVLWTLLISHRLLFFCFIVGKNAY